MIKKFFVGYGIEVYIFITALDEDWLGDTKIFDYFTLKMKSR